MVGYNLNLFTRKQTRESLEPQKENRELVYETEQYIDERTQKQGRPDTDVTLVLSINDSQMTHVLSSNCALRD